MNASIITVAPTTIADLKIPIPADMLLHHKVMSTVAPRIKLGTVVVAVERMFVPNCSEATAIITAQYPCAMPSAKRMKKNMLLEIPNELK